MRIVVNVFLYLKCYALLFHFETDNDVQILVFGSGFGIILAILIVFGRISVFNIVACVMIVCVYVNTFIYKRFGKFVKHIVFTSEVYHRAGFAKFVDKVERGNVGCLCHFGVVGTECGCNVNDTCTVFGGNVVAGDNTECLLGNLYKCIFFVGKAFVGMSGGVFLYKFSRKVVNFFARFYPLHHLLVMHSHKVGTFVTSHNAVGNYLVAGFECFHVGFCTFGFEICV